MSFLEFFDKGYRELHPEAQAFWSMGKFGLAGATLAGGLAMGGPIGAAAAALKVPSIVSTFNAGRTALADVARSNDISAADISQSISHSARRGVDAEMAGLSTEEQGRFAETLAARVVDPHYTVADPTPGQQSALSLADDARANKAAMPQFKESPVEWWALRVDGGAA